MVERRLRGTDRAIVELAKSPLDGSVSSGLTSIDMQRLAGDKGGPFEVEDPVDNVADFAEPAERMEICHARIGGGVVPRPDYPQGDSIHPNSA